jgi:hypothetical protein
MKSRIANNIDEMKSAKVEWTEGMIINATATFFEWWKNTCVPHVYLGPSSREMDLAVISKNGLLWTVEVKISRVDWRNDNKKLNKFPYAASPARFYYVVPDLILEKVKDELNPSLKFKVPDFVPDWAGVIGLGNTRKHFTREDGTIEFCDSPKRTFVKPCKSLHRNKLDPKYKEELYKKISIRYWSHVTGIDMSKIITLED